MKRCKFTKKNLVFLWPSNYVFLQQSMEIYRIYWVFLIIKVFFKTIFWWIFTQELCIFPRKLQEIYTKIYRPRLKKLVNLLKKSCKKPQIHMDIHIKKLFSKPSCDGFLHNNHVFTLKNRWKYTWISFDIFSISIFLLIKLVNLQGKTCGKTWI